jgi:hypothetical protein
VTTERQLRFRRVRYALSASSNASEMLTLNPGLRLLRLSATARAFEAAAGVIEMVFFTVLPGNSVFRPAPFLFPPCTPSAPASEL